MVIDAVHKKKFEEIWDKGDYRQGSTAHRMLDRITQIIPAGSAINDYGSGTGRADVVLYEKGYRVRMIDIAGNALEKDASALLKKNLLAFTLADLSDLSEILHSPWGICINVLMTVQPKKLDKILSDIRQTCDNLIFEAYDFDDKVRLGHQLTTVKLDKQQWQEKLLKYWPTVKFEASPESAHRYIFVCTSGINSLKNKYTGQTCYIVGRGASLLLVKKIHFESGVVIALNEAIHNIYELNLKNKIYNQWRAGDIPQDITSYLRQGDGLILCEDRVLELPKSSELFRDYLPRYLFDCQRDLGRPPASMFSHASAFEIAYQIFGCRKFVMVGFDSYLGDNRTVLKKGFIHSEYRPGDYKEQIEIMKKIISEKTDVEVDWFFPKLKR